VARALYMPKACPDDRSGHTAITKRPAANVAGSRSTSNRREGDELMMNRTRKMMMTLGMVVIGAVGVFAQGRPQDPLAPLKRAISQASAPTLSPAQEAALTTLINEYKAALPDESDEVIEAAREAYDAAILAGDFAAAQVQATTLTTRGAQLLDARLQATARLSIGSIAVLKSGGQYNPLVTKYGTDRVLQLVSLQDARGGIGGGPGGPGGGRR